MIQFYKKKLQISIILIFSDAVRDDIGDVQKAVAAMRDDVGDVQKDINVMKEDTSK